MSGARRWLLAAALLLAPIRADAAGAQTLALRVQGRSRFARVHLPAGHDPARAWPVVLVFHGDAGRSARMPRLTGFNAAADAAGLLVVYPEGTGWLGLPPKSWNAGVCCGYAKAVQVDDVAFVRALLDELERRYRIDPARVYATGMSNGAMLAYRLACELADRISAVAPVAGTMDLAACRPSAPVSVLAFHGTADRHVPFEGGPVAMGGESRRDPPVRDVIDFWVRHNAGRAGTDVVLERIESGRHAWPSDPPATERIVRFFAEHPKPR